MPRRLRNAGGFQQVKVEMLFFIAGVMQGSSYGNDVIDQDYREVIRGVLERHIPDADVYDPWADHQESMTYSDAEGKRVFLQHNELCGQVDVLVAFIPQASMGTAIEMWEAYRNGRKVIAISPMEHNWAIKFVSNYRYDSLDDFVRAVEDGSFKVILASANHKP